MKKVLILSGLLALATLDSFAQCNEYYQIENGSEWEMETYNAKGKLATRNQQKVTSFDKTSTGFKANINAIAYNEKGKELTKGDIEMECENGTLLMDMRRFISEDQLKAFGNFQMKVEGNALELPSKLSIGQTLKDGTLIISTVDSPMPMKMTVDIVDRKVVAKESITTPAGTFECYKISSTMNMQNKVGITMNFTFSTLEWVAPKVGFVKSETYKKEKLEGYTVLTKRK